jgi:5'-nucleotidase
MNILLTNEAGCFAPGIIALAKVLSAKHRVVIVAPLNPQINCGHAFTRTEPLRVRQYFALNRVKIFSVNGTPCDCVTLALDKILHSKPDLIVTGIRDRHSRGEVIYTSGVAAAAKEGTIQGIPSIALSGSVKNVSDEAAFIQIANAFSKNLNYLVKNMPANTTLNVNFPEKFFARKVVCTPLTCDMVSNEHTPEVNPFGNTYYWLKTPVMGFTLSALEQKGDLYWLKKGYITVTPLKLNLTCDDAIPVVTAGGISL